jgi:hypothetical protein
MVMCVLKRFARMWRPLAPTQSSRVSRPATPPVDLKRPAADIADAIDFTRSSLVEQRHRAVLRRIRAEIAGGRPPRIAFLVSERSKWNADSLLEEMRTAGWSTRLYLGLRGARYADRKDKVDAYRAERDFFTRVDGDVVDLYDWEEDRELVVEDVVDADVVFFQQPWGMENLPRRLVSRSLGAYMHYGFILMANDQQHYNMGSFHPYLWRYFAQTEAHRELQLKNDPSAYDRISVTGYPKLDVYFSEPGESDVWAGPRNGTIRIVYAPHHSVGRRSLGMSTFGWNHQTMLNLARTTPGTQWVYKPHPNLRYKVAQNKIMTRDEYITYEESWSGLPNAAVYDSGRYFDIFRSSDVLITDCGSFLAEYLPTGAPIIWLASANSVGFNPVGRSLAEAYYKADSLESLQNVFTRVVMDGHDPLKEVRTRMTNRLFPAVGRAATAVVEELRRQLVDNR